jgi:hypothetical protein
MTPAFAIRFAMLLSVLLFGGVSVFLRRAGEVPPGVVQAGTFVLMGRILWIAALVGCALLFLRARKARTASQMMTTGVIAWALGEGVAIFGGMVFYLTGLSTWYFLGVGFLVVTFLTFPARPAA